jgi:gliding motility-associated-like protein
VRVEDGFFLYIPNSFSPNDDVINDYFFPVITGDFSPKNYSFEIFDRWGELLYRSNNPYETKWNGCYKGEICKDDVYVWKLNIQNLKGTIQKNAGHVTLMK